MEVVLVIGLLGMIFGLTAFMSVSSYQGTSFRNERDALIGVLQRARSQAVNNICLSPAGACTDSLPHAVHVTETNYTIFQGNKTYSDPTRDTSTDEIIEVSAPINPVSFDVIFTQLSGDATTIPAGTGGFSTFTIADNTGHDSAITISSFGQISWTN